MSGCPDRSLQLSAAKHVRLPASAALGFISIVCMENRMSLAEVHRGLSDARVAEAP